MMPEINFLDTIGLDNNYFISNLDLNQINEDKILYHN